MEIFCIFDQKKTTQRLQEKKWHYEELNQIQESRYLFEESQQCLCGGVRKLSKFLYSNLLSLSSYKLEKASGSA